MQIGAGILKKWSFDAAILYSIDSDLAGKKKQVVEFTTMAISFISLFTSQLFEISFLKFTF